MCFVVRPEANKLEIKKEVEIVDSYYSLIKPEPEYYSYWNTRVHGLTMEDTMNARVFPEVWAEIEPKIEGLPLVAHNSPFDEGLHMPSLQKKVGISPTQPPTTNRSCLLRVRPNPTP